MSAVALRSPDGSFAGAIGINVDVTALKQREVAAGRGAAGRAQRAGSAGQAIAVVKGGAVARCNDAFLQLLRMRPDELAAVPVADCLPNAPNGAKWPARPSGHRSRTTL